VTPANAARPSRSGLSSTVTRNAPERGSAASTSVAPPSVTTDSVCATPKPILSPATPSRGRGGARGVRGGGRLLRGAQPAVAQVGREREEVGQRLRARARVAAHEQVGHA